MLGNEERFDDFGLYPTSNWCPIVRFEVEASMYMGALVGGGSLCAEDR